MDQVELVENLKKRGYHVGMAYSRTDGVLMIRINEVMMRAADAEKLAQGNATLEEIVGPADNYVPPEVRSDVVGRH